MDTGARGRRAQPSPTPTVVALLSTGLLQDPLGFAELTSMAAFLFRFLSQGYQDCVVFPAAWFPTLQLEEIIAIPESLYKCILCEQTFFLKDWKVNIKHCMQLP